MFIQEPSFKLLGWQSQAMYIHYAHINITRLFLEEYNTTKKNINNNLNLILGI